MMTKKSIKSRITTYIDNADTPYLYFFPILGGIKYYRANKNKINSSYKASILEIAKILTFFTILHGLIYIKPTEISLGSIVYYSTTKFEDI